MKRAGERPIRAIWVIYLTCFAFRLIEYFVIRTDQGIIGEAFLHKLVGIGILALALRYLEYRWRDIGFGTKGAARGLAFGLLLGAVVMATAYGAEILLQNAAGNAPSLQVYVTSYTAVENRVMQGGAVVLLVCILGNIINVVMEEGVFRGLFIRLAQQKYSFVKAAVFSSLLFGVWHIVSPLRNALDGVQSPMGAVMMALMLIGSSALAGMQFAMLFEITGALWAPMALHFVNNTTVNLLHVVTATGADELQTIRMSVSGTLAFVLVLALFLRHRAAGKR